MNEEREEDFQYFSFFKVRPVSSKWIGLIGKAFEGVRGEYLVKIKGGGGENKNEWMNK